MRCDTLTLTGYIQCLYVELCSVECLLIIILGLKALGLIIVTKAIFVLRSKQVPEALCFVFCYFARWLDISTHPGISGCRAQRSGFVYLFQ